MTQHLPADHDREPDPVFYGHDAMDFTIGEAILFFVVVGAMELWVRLKMFPTVFVNWLKLWGAIVFWGGLSIGLLTASLLTAIIGGLLLGLATSTFYHWYTVRSAT